MLLKTFAQISTFALASTLLIGCGGSSSSGSNADSSDKETTPQTTFTYPLEDYTLIIDLPKKGAQVGQTVFAINLSDNFSNPQAGITPTIKPMMDMGSHKHSSPYSGCTETDTEGNANCTVYFNMASVAPNGDAMGTWNIDMTLPNTQTGNSSDGSETITFTPEVNMAMGTTRIAKLRGGSDDQAPSMNDKTDGRQYLIFNNGISGSENNKSVELFIAAKETMMHFPALTTELTLNAGNRETELTISDIVVEVSTDNSNWTTATPNGNSNGNGNGIWTADDISGLTNELYVSLKVNGEIKTTDGEVAGTENASAMFVISGM